MLPAKRSDSGFRLLKAWGRSIFRSCLSKPTGEITTLASSKTWSLCVLFLYRRDLYSLCLIGFHDSIVHQIPIVSGFEIASGLGTKITQYSSRPERANVLMPDVNQIKEQGRQPPEIKKTCICEHQRPQRLTQSG